MQRESINGRVYIKSGAFNQIKNLRHGFTTARGGFSSGKIKGLNLGFRVGDDKESVLKNYRAVASDLDLTYENMVLSRQTHTDNIRIVTKEDRGKGLTRASDIFDTDALITNEKNTPLVVFSADCIPILLAEKNERAIGAVHAGWRGTVMKIPKKAVELMKSEYGAEPKNIFAAIGAGIGKCCFEVGEEVASEFEAEFVCRRQGEKPTVDLWAANFKALLEAGVLPENIELANICTKCSADEFYSYRAMGERTGRLGALIELK